MEMARIWHFREFFHFYPILDYYKIRTRTNFENPHGISSDLHLVIWIMLKGLFLGSTDFTEVIFKIPQISKHFSANRFAAILTTKISEVSPLQSKTIIYYFVAFFIILSG